MLFLFRCCLIMSHHSIDRITPLMAFTGHDGILGEKGCVMIMMGHSISFLLLSASVTRGRGRIRWLCVWIMEEWESLDGVCL